jgi:FMN-dependent NADH-azoreductase
MTTLLQINSSLFSDNGISSQLADAFVARWKAANPMAQVRRRDLAQQPIAHMDAARLTALGLPAAERDTAQRQAAAEAEGLIAELVQADVLVLGVPMYNFSVPSQLKAWFDHIARAGVTFRYTESGSQGLLSGKRAYVFTSRGGLHRGQPQDGVVPYLNTMLSFIGIDAVEFVYAEGLNLGDAPRRQALQGARAEIDALLRAA